MGRTRERTIEREAIYAALRDRAGIDMKIAEVKAQLAPLHAELDDLIRLRDSMNNKNLAKQFGVGATMIKYMEDGWR